MPLRCTRITSEVFSAVSSIRVSLQELRIFECRHSSYIPSLSCTPSFISLITFGEK